MVFVWIAGYGIVYALVSLVPRQISPWLLPCAMLGYACALFFWVVRTGGARRLRLRIPRQIRWSRFLPLLMLPAYNLLTVKDFPPGLSELLLMLAVCAVEELFFRGFLLCFLQKYGPLTGILLSSAVFALLHFANLASGAEPSLLTAQVLCAFSAGLCYSAAAVQTDSLLPGFGAHFLTNITAGTALFQPTPLFWACITVYGVYGIILCKPIIKKKELPA